MKRIFFLISAILLCTTTTLSFSAPPPAKSVFKVTVKTYNPNTFFLEFKIKPGYFLYRDRLTLTQSNTNYLELTPLNLPKAKIKIDALNQKVAIYRDKLRIPVNIIGLHPGEDILHLRYQGCADDGFCYPPRFTDIKLTINTAHAITAVSLLEPQKIKTPTPKTHQATFSGHHWFVTLLIFLGLGLLLSFTPCVLPMIPVLSGILVGHGENLSTRKAFLLSLSYVLSMASTYAIIGAFIALMGQNLQLYLQSPIAIFSFSFIFVLLALAMFDVYELKLPLSWQAKIAKLSYQQKRGQYLSAAVMGALSTLILSPCVTAPLIGALGFIAQTGNITLGMAALFSLGLGMGLPLLLIGASLGRFLPHAGHWMTLIKQCFGLILLAVAIYLLARVLSLWVTMFLWGGLFIVSGLVLSCFQEATSRFIYIIIRSIGILCLIYGVLILIGASLGHTNPFQPLTQKKITQTVHKSVVTDMKALEKALKNAHLQKQPVLLDFYADWCTACQVIESKTLQDPKVLYLLKNVQLIKVDLTANNHESRALLHEFNVIAPPTFIFIDTSSREHPSLRLFGNIRSDELKNNLNALLNTN